MNHFKIIFLPFVLFCLPLNAQENMDERITGVENTISKLPGIAPNINLRYRYDDTDGANGFDVRRARLDVRGNVTKPLEYRIHLEFANSPRVLDANINWKIKPNLTLMAGQYKIPFSLENPYNPNVLEMIENSLVITHLVNYSDVSGISANGRDVGVSLNRSLFQKDGYSLITCFFGVFNGSGINRADENKAKDFSGILSINPSKQLTFAVSHYNGSTGADSSAFQRVRNGFGVKYDDNRLLVRSEYIRGKTWDTTNMKYFNSEGAYVVGACYVVPKVQVVARYDYFKRDIDGGAKQQDYTAGVNYLPANNVRLQFNYIHKTNETASNLLVTQLWIKF